jgi:hypothetical protein
VATSNRKTVFQSSECSTTVQLFRYSNAPLEILVFGVYTSSSSTTSTCSTRYSIVQHLTSVFVWTMHSAHHAGCRRCSMVAVCMEYSMEMVYGVWSVLEYRVM